MMSEINVTPFVDVMLVLLVVFMVTAPLMEHSVDVQLPQTSAKAKEAVDVPTISLKNNKRIYWNQEELATLIMLDARLDEYLSKSKDGGVNLRADRSLEYGFVVRVLAKVKGKGVQKIGMITEPEA